MSDDYKQNLKDHSTWVRGLYIVLFTVIYSVTEIVIALIVTFQFLSVLLTRQTNDKLLTLSLNLSSYIFQILKYITFNSNDRPYPFSDFPDYNVSTSEQTPAPAPEPVSEQAPAVKKKKAAKKKAAKKVPKKDSDDSTGSDDVVK